jgi:hypothetical protein
MVVELRVRESRHPLACGKVCSTEESRERAVASLVTGKQHEAWSELCVGNPTPLCMRNETSEWPPLPRWEWPVGETIMRRSTVHARRSCSRKWEHDPIAIRHCWIAQLKLHAEECG